MRITTLVFALLLTSTCQMLHAEDNYVEPLMVPIPAGEFSMGSNNDNDSEEPIHKVNVSAFNLAKSNVTLKEFLLFVDATNYKPKSDCWGRERKGALTKFPVDWESDFKFGEFFPVRCVDWNDAQAYIAWLNKQTGKRYRLPTEAEWEYATRAGSTQAFYYSDNENELCRYENIFDLNSAATMKIFGWTNQPIACNDDQFGPSVVGVYEPNSFGLHDMVGNVSEWVEDCYHADYRGAPKTGKAWLSKSCVHFARGGSWASSVIHLRSSFRPSSSVIAKEAAETQRFFDRGFRLALTDNKATHKAASELQQNFVQDLTKAQQTAIEKMTAAKQNRNALTAKYKTWPNTPTTIPPMVSIPGGEFLMGNNFSDNEKPVHKVSVKPFKISKYEVTVGQFKQFAASTYHIPLDMLANECWKFVDENGGPFKDGIEVLTGNWLTPEYAPSDFHPVMCVSWDDANAYLSWLSQQTGKKYRLPTEAEWEYAARARSTTKYFFGDDEKDLCKYANTFDESGLRAFVRDKNYKKTDVQCDDGAEYTSIVGMYQPNKFGLYDMIGNVSEWVEDCDHPNFEGAPTDGSAWMAEDCNMRTRKGSIYGPSSNHTTMRGHGGQGNRSSLGEGFRIVEEIPLNEAKDSNNTSVSTTDFEIELAKAQK